MLLHGHPFASLVDRPERTIYVDETEFRLDDSESARAHNRDVLQRFTQNGNEAGVVVVLPPIMIPI